MKLVRTLAVAFLVVGTLTCAGVSAQQTPSYPRGPAGALVPAQHAGQYGYVGSTLYGGASSPTAELAKQYVKATKEDEKRDLRKKLADALNQEFDVHLQHQQKELEDLEKQIASLRTLLKKRVDSKSAIVERRLEQLVQEAEGLGWSGPASPRPTYYQVGSPFGGSPLTAPAPKTPDSPKK